MNTIENTNREEPYNAKEMAENHLWWALMECTTGSGLLTLEEIKTELEKVTKVTWSYNIKLIKEN